MSLAQALLKAGTLCVVTGKQRSNPEEAEHKEENS